jgi:serine/threonine-protein kinase
LETEPFDRVIGRYRVVAKLGRGSMGTVYRAVASDGNEVAIKVMAPELSDDPDLLERFRREAMTAAAIDHPNITRVYDFGQEGRQLFMAMELLDGADLKAVIEQQAVVAIPVKLTLMEQVARGMAAVHARGFVHRDIKPANIHLKSNGQIKIMDFGLVRLGDSSMTATGMAMGSPAYMAPEQLRGEKADARSDVFSMGAVFYELLAGQRAFPGKGVAQILMNVISTEPAPLAQISPATPRPVGAIVERCLKKDQASRYQSAGELHAALEVARAVYSR